MIDPFSLTIAGAGAGGTWTAAYAWAKREGMSHSDAVKRANKVTKKTFRVAVSVATIVTNGDFSRIIDNIVDNAVDS